MIRVATTEDADQLAGLYVRTLRDAYAGAMPSDLLDPVSKDDRAAKLRAAIVGGSRVWLIAASDEELVGCCGLCPARDDDLSSDIGEITTISVDAKHRRHGHGLGLLSAARIEAARHGWRALVLWVAASNAGARAFYSRSDFTPDGAARVDDRLGFSAPVVRYRGAAAAV